MFTVFLDMMPCNSVDRYLEFVGACYPHLQGRPWQLHIPGNHNYKEIFICHFIWPSWSQIDAELFLFLVIYLIICKREKLKQSRFCPLNDCSNISQLRVYGLACRWARDAYTQFELWLIQNIRTEVCWLSSVTLCKYQGNIFFWKGCFLLSLLSLLW